MATAQIHPTDAENERLRLISQRTGRTREDLLREGLDLLFSRFGDGDRLTLLRRGRGIWRDRGDLPSLEELRAEMDRS